MKAVLQRVFSAAVVSDGIPTGEINKGLYILLGVEKEDTERDADLLCEKISKELHQTATIVEAQGAFSHTNKQMVICVTKKNNIPNLEKMIAEFPDAVIFESVVSNSIISTNYI